jgi:hypothetical protein
MNKVKNKNSTQAAMRGGQDAPQTMQPKYSSNSTQSLSHILLLKILLSIYELKGKQFHNIILIIKFSIWDFFFKLFLWSTN